MDQQRSPYCTHPGASPLNQSCMGCACLFVSKVKRCIILGQTRVSVISDDVEPFLSLGLDTLNKTIVIVVPS